MYFTGSWTTAQTFTMEGISVSHIHDRWFSFNELYLGKLRVADANANTPRMLWLASAGSITQVQHARVSYSDSGVLLSGSFQGNFSAGTFVIPEPSHVDFGIFLVKFSPRGTVLWGSTSSGGATSMNSNRASFHGIVTGSDGDTYMAVTVAGRVRMGSAFLESAGRSNGFLVRLGHGGAITSPNIIYIDEGGTGTYSVTLRTIPTNPVTVTMTTSRGVLIQPSSLIFSSAAWNTPQTVTATVLDDAVAYDPQYSRNVTLSGTSQDSEYESDSLAGVQILITDNDGPAEVSSLSPATAMSMDQFTLTVKGSQFGESSAEFHTILLNGIPCPNSLWNSSTLVQCQVAPRTFLTSTVTRSLSLQVTVVTDVVDLRTVPSFQMLTLSRPKPISTSIFPLSGRWQGNSTVTIRGKNFDQSMAVLFGAARVRACHVTRVLSDNAIICITPPGNPDQQVAVYVKTPGVALGNSSLYYHYSEQCVPECTSSLQHCVQAQCVCIHGRTGLSCEQTAITVTDSLAVTEGGEAFPVHVSIAVRPLSNITVTLSVTSQRLMLSEPTVSFLSNDLWTRPRVVYVSGILDAPRLGNESFTLAADVVSPGDGRFHGLKLLSEGVVAEGAPQIMNIDPRVSPLNGTSVRLAIANIDGAAVIKVAGGIFPVRLSNVTVASATLDSVTVLVHEVTIFTPQVQGDSYHDVDVQNADGTRASLRQAIYFTDTCQGDSTQSFYGAGAECRPCPEGAICPGGFRMWPQPGWWNTDEFEGRVYRCPPPYFQCIGGRLSPCLEGYQGRVCGTCSDNYYRDGSLCLKCDSRVSLGLLISIQTIFFAALLLAIVLLSKPLLNTFLTAITVLQLVWALGQNENSRFPRWLQASLSWTALVTLDASFVRPGCEIDVSPVILFYTSLGTLLIGLMLLPVLTFLRSVVRSAFFRKSGKPNLGRYNITRLYRAITIVLTFLYTEVCSQTMMMLFCRKIEGRYVLAHHPDVECYKGDHVAATIIATITMLCYCIGLPACVATYLFKSNTLGNLSARLFRKKFGYWYERFRPEVYNFRALIFITTFTLVASATFFRRYPVVQFVVCLVMLSCLAAFVTVLRPFLRQTMNHAIVLISFLAMSFTILNFLAWERFGLSNDELNISFFSLLVLGVLLGGMVTYLAPAGESHARFYERKENESHQETVYDSKHGNDSPPQSDSTSKQHGPGPEIWRPLPRDRPQPAEGENVYGLDDLSSISVSRHVNSLAPPELTESGARTKPSLRSKENGGAVSVTKRSHPDAEEDPVFL
eukprot:TRINITY_DN3556_c0_g1_i2.p1 TRINITY_DN3556_c0_g1~~TRINITY_DN3556_c0_g1_i2.p1  ORF type:complete len:1274 (+),score=87.86 TRINITY_DN3556_c0_g1_i2:1380-5201(+)